MKFKEIMDLDEAVEIPATATIDDIMSMMEAAMRAMSLAKRLQNPVDRRKHILKVMVGMTKIRDHMALLANQ